MAWSNLNSGSAATCAALSAGVAVSLGAFVGDAYAQDVQLDAINVEGQGGAGENSYLPSTGFASPKQTAPILNTPQTVTVIPQAVIREQGGRNLSEVLRNTPGISFDAGENGFATSTNNFKLRGFDSSGNVFIDGARDSGSYARDIFNIERVEVVKGGASDNGRGGAGGYINMVTKTPTLRNFIAGEFGYGFDQYRSGDRKRGTIDLNAIVGSNTAIRFNGLIEDSGVPGRDVGEMKPMGLAPSIAFGLGTDFRAIFAYEYVRRRDLPDWGVPGATIPGTINYSPTTMGARRDAFYGLRSDVDNVDSNAALMRFEYDISKTAKLTNQTRWSQVDRFARYTIPFGYVPATQTVTSQTQFYDRTNTSLTNLTNLSAEVYTGPFKHNLSLGFDVTREESRANRYPTSNPGDTNIFQPDPFRFGVSDVLPTERNDVSIDTVAAYIYDTLELSRQWQLTGGVRVENYDVKIGSMTAAGAPATLNGYTDSRTTVSGKFGVIYKPAQNGTFYVSWSSSAQPPGSYLSNPDISRTGEGAFPGLIAGADPVRIENYEAGTKWEFFNGQLLATAAVFRTNKKNVAITGRDAGETIDTLKGYGQQHVEGVEFGLSGKITDAWQVFGGMAFMRSERNHSAYLDEVRRRASPSDYGIYGTTSGDQLSFTPNVTANLWTTYRLPIGLTVGGGMQYVGESYIGRPDDATRIIANGVYGKLPSYTLFHAMASYEIRKDVELRFNIDNIADVRHAVSTNWPANRATLGIPRTYRISTSFRF